MTIQVGPGDGGAGMRTKATERLIGATTAACLAAAVLGACSSDGRTLRPAGPGQSATISSPETSSSDAILPSPSTAPSSTTPTSAASSTSVAAAQLVSTPWPAGGAIDARHTCDGADVSPALAWSPAPAGTAEIAVSMVDVDVDHVHWVVAGLDPTSTGIAEGGVPAGSIQAINDSGNLGWSGPCGPPGTTHVYTVTVWYLGQQTEVGAGAPADDLLSTLQATAIARAQTTGTYTR